MLLVIKKRFHLEFRKTMLQSSQNCCRKSTFLKMKATDLGIQNRAGKKWQTSVDNDVFSSIDFTYTFFFFFTYAFKKKLYIYYWGLVLLLTH